MSKFRLESSIDCSTPMWIKIYLQSPVVEADVLHGVSPERLWDVCWEPEVPRDQHKYSLYKKKCKKLFLIITSLFEHDP